MFRYSIRGPMLFVTAKKYGNDCTLKRQRDNTSASSQRNKLLFRNATHDHKRTF